MYDDVKKDVKELLNILNRENADFRADLDKLGLDVVVMFRKPQEVLSEYREKFHAKYFSFVDKYVNDKAFLVALNVEENLEELIYTKFLISDEFYYGVLDQYYSSEEKLLSDCIVFDENDLQYFFNRGVSLKTIVEKYQLSSQVQETLCKDYPQFANQIISTNGFLALSIVINEISKGNYQPLEKYFSYDYDHFSDELLTLLKELGNFEKFDFEKVFDIIIDAQHNLGEFSVLNDDNLVKKLISIGGSKALIFANNPSAELVSLTDFSYSDYTLYDGDYRNSSALLLKFLKEGKLDALKYAKSGAITEEAIQIIDQNNISLETLKSYREFKESSLGIKYFVKKGDYPLIVNLPNLFTDLKEFNYARSVIKNYNVDLDTYDDRRGRLLNGLLNNKYSWRIYSVDMSLEVAQKILDMGLSVDDFINHFDTSENWDNLIQAFCIKGEFLPLFFVKSQQLAEQYSDKITYNFYLEAQKKIKSFHPSDIWLYKFIKEGHFDLISNYSNELGSDLLKRALFWGYFPEEKILDSGKFKERVKNLSFSKEELEYLKSKLNGNSRYVIFFPELLNSNDVLLKYIEDVPLIFQMLDESKKADFLRFLLKTEPELCAKLGYIELSLLMSLIKENLEVLKYFSFNQLGDGYSRIDMIKSILDFNSNAMDFIDISILLDDEIEKYLLNGYKFSANSPSRLIVYALDKGIEVPKNVLFDLDLNNLLGIINDLNYNTKFSTLFEEVFSNFYQKNPMELTYEYYQVYFWKNSARKDFLIKLFEGVGISYNRNFDIEDKDEFSLIYQLATLPKAQESLTKIDEILKKPEYLDKIDMAFRWLFTKFDPSEKILKKREFADKYFEVDPHYLVYYIDCNDPKYQPIVRKFLESDAKKYVNLFYRFPFILNEKELVKKALTNKPEAFFDLPSEYFNSETYGYVKELVRERYDYINPFYRNIVPLIHFPNFDVTNYEDCKFVFRNIIYNICKSGHANLIDKNDNQLKKIFARAAEIYEKKEADFKELVSLSQNMDISLFTDDFQIVLKDAVSILNSTGKLNTLEKNPIFSYDLVKYVYPLFGIDFVKDLLKYNTPAAEVIVDEIKNNNQKFLLDYYNLICQYNVFEADDKRVHFAFVNFKEIKELVGDILDNKEPLSETDVTNLKKVIINKNQYKIKSLAELKQFDYVTRKYWHDIKVKNNIDDIKNALATMFGYNDVNSLENAFNGFQLGNFVNLEEVRTDIIEHYGATKAEEIFEKCFYDKKDISIVTLMKQVTESENINELKELLECHLSNTGEPVDYSDDVRRIITKIRMLYNYQFNAHLTKIEDIKSKRLEKDNPNNPYGVTIIEMNDERFNFLVHRLYSYDNSMEDFQGRLMADPSLWTKLEGATTLSTSSISDKGFWFLENGNPDGVVYLFNNPPENFLLFMNGRDLYVEHGGYKIEPTAARNAFTTIDGLNQCSCYKKCKYNEVAGNREGMLPCALACVGDKPNEATIRAAKYFSQYLGVDIPIIKFDIKAYDAKKQKDADKAKNDFKIKPTKESMKGIFFDGIRLADPKKAPDSIKGKITYCMDILKDKYYQKEISFEEYYQLLLQMESMVSLITVDLPDAKKEMRKISLLRESLNTLKQLSKEEVLNLEEAALGESGIMYKYHDENKDYLVKPAVDKKKLASQPFRAEIQAAASKLQMILSPETSVKVESLGGDLKLSRQELVSVSKEKANALENWVDYGGPLDYHYSNALLKEYVVDFLLCNFDCFVGNFIIDSNNNVRGIDKEQSFRFMNNAESLKPDFSYVPNGDARIPIYKIMFERYEKGEIDLDLSVVSATIENVKLLSDEEYKNIFHDYAYKLSKNHGEDILNAILKRRDVAIGRMEEYIEKLQSMKKAEGVSLC